MDWKEVLEIFAVIGGIATVFGLILAPMFWLGAKIDAFRQDIYAEMKDFHGRLERQDEAFKSHLLNKHKEG